MGGFEREGSDMSLMDIFVVGYLTVLLYFASIAAVLTYHGKWTMNNCEWFMFISAVLCWPLVVVWFVIEKMAMIIIKYVLSRKG